MSSPTLTEAEETLLRAVQAQEAAELYDLSQTLGIGPQAVQEAVQTLARHDFVHVSGRRVRCTAAGDRWVREHQ